MIFNILTALVAIYGAILSSLVFFKDRRKKLIVELYSPFKDGIRSGNLLDDIALADHLPSIKDLSIKIINDWHKGPIFINKPFIVDLSKNILLSPQFEQVHIEYPYRIESGSSLILTFSQERLEAKLIPRSFSGEVAIKASVAEQTGKTFYSNPFVIELGEQTEN